MDVSWPAPRRDGGKNHALERVLLRLRALVHQASKRHLNHIARNAVETLLAEATRPSTVQFTMVDSGGAGRPSLFKVRSTSRRGSSRCCGLNCFNVQREPGSNSIPRKYPISLKTQYLTIPIRSPLACLIRSAVSSGMGTSSCRHAPVSEMSSRLATLFLALSALVSPADIQHVRAQQPSFETLIKHTVVLSATKTQRISAAR